MTIFEAEEILYGEKWRTSNLLLKSIVCNKIFKVGYPLVLNRKNNKNNFVVSKIIVVDQSIALKITNGKSNEVISPRNVKVDKVKVRLIKLESI